MVADDDAATAPRNTRATMQDVARATGVSAKTVSRVVNNNGAVSAATREVVEAAMARLGFRRNEAARMLRLGRAEVIGLVIDDISDPFYSNIARAVEDVAFERGHTLLIGSYARDPARAQSIVEAFGARGAGGLVVVPADAAIAEAVRREVAAGSAVVLVDRPLEGVDADVILSDNAAATRSGVEHLTRAGHRRIAFVGDDETVFSAGERRAGYLAALEAGGIRLDPRLLVDTPPDRMYSAIDELVGMAEAPTAILTGNGRATVAAIRVLAARGLSERVALVGFDDVEMAEALRPAVTVIAQDLTAMGGLAVAQLLRRLDGDRSAYQTVRLPTRLIARGSGEIPAP